MWLLIRLERIHGPRDIVQVSVVALVAMAGTVACLLIEGRCRTHSWFVAPIKCACTMLSVANVLQVTAAIIFAYSTIQMVWKQFFL